MNSRQQFTPWLWLVAAIFFVFNAFTSWFVSPTGDLDQAQQLVLSQTLSLGYGKQPPLYSWIVYLIFSVIGPSLLALYLLKASLLTLIVVGVKRIASELDFTARQQVVAVLGLALLPQLSWEAQRDLTHTVLATLMSTWSLWAFIRLSRQPDWRNYILFGLFCGLGLLSKYNFAVFAAGLILAALFLQPYRHLLFTPRFLVSIAVGAVLILPHFYWVLENIDEVIGSREKLRIVSDAGLADSVFAVIKAVAAFSGLLVVTYGLCWRKGVAHTTNNIHQKFLAYLFSIITVLLLLIFIMTGATHLKDRWLLPILFFVPIMLAGYGVGRPIIFSSLASGLLLFVAVALPGRILYPDQFWGISGPSLPYVSFARSIASEIKPPDLVVSGQQLLAGNLRLAFPDARVLVVQSPEHAQRLIQYYSDKNILLVMDDRGGDKGEALSAWVDFFGRTDTPLRFNDQPMLYAPSSLHSVAWRFFIATPK